MARGELLTAHLEARELEQDTPRAAELRLQLAFRDLREAGMGIAEINQMAGMARSVMRLIDQKIEEETNVQ